MQNYSVLKQSIVDKKWLPVYFFDGEEPFFMDQLTHLLEEIVLPEETKDFDLTILYGKETTMQNVLSACKRFPMMAPVHLVIVKEAQHLAQHLDLLKSYVENPNETTILVFNFKYKKLDRRKQVAKVLVKKNYIFTSAKLYENKIPAFIQEQFKILNIQITPVANQMMVENLGVDLTKINNAIQKLSLIANGEQITPDLVEKHIGISKTYNNFEFQKAIGFLEKEKAFKIACYFAKNPQKNPLVVTVSVLYNYFTNIIIYHTTVDKSKMNLATKLRVSPYFVSDYARAAKNYPLRKAVQNISVLRDIDLKSKGVGVSSISNEELLKELFFLLLT